MPWQRTSTRQAEWEADAAAATPVKNDSVSRFDREAPAYDARAGLPLEKRSQIARAVVELSGLAAGDVLLELGAGTGQLGVCFPAFGLQYVGLDASAPMLEEFERRRPAGLPAIRLIHADADDDWPIRSRSVRAVFCSRAAHLFALEHVVAETRRVTVRSGAAFILGRVERDEHGIRSVLRREMRAMLVARGFAPREGDRTQRRVLEAFRAGGATALDPVIASRWPVTSSATTVLDAWRRKPGLGGCEPPEATKTAILADLHAWSAARFGSLHAPDHTEDRYVLEGVAFPGAQ
jgi:ubiquinone/menaquinone biosynthesis C-methylase UbiE